MLKKLLISIITCSFILGCSFFSQSTITFHSVEAASSQKLHLQGTKIVNSQNKVVQLKGLSTHGLSWFPQYINKKTFMQLKKDFKINTIRLAMYTEEYNGYCKGSSANKKKLKALIHKAVQYTKELNMYVIIDWHILNDGNPNKHITAAKNFFGEMAKKYKKENHIIYEICNEPNHTSWSQIKKYAQKVIPKIRQYKKDALVIVGTPTWSQDVDKISKLSDKYTLYALHFYAGTHKQSLRNKLTLALKKKIPVFVSEFGMCNASGHGSLNKTETKKWLQLLDKNKVGYVAWNISNKNESSAILKSSCKKTSGFKTSDYSLSGQWLKSYFSGKLNTSTKSKVSLKKPIAVSTKAKITTKRVNDWKEGNQRVSQWNITIKNNNKAKSKWTLKLKWNQSIQIKQYWNCKIRKSGNTLTITPVSYNKKVKAKGTIRDVGIIIKSHSLPKVSSSSFY